MWNRIVWNSTFYIFIKMDLTLNNLQVWYAIKPNQAKLRMYLFWLRSDPFSLKYMYLFLYIYLFILRINKYILSVFLCVYIRIHTSSFIFFSLWVEYIYIYKLVTVVEGDEKAPFSFAKTPNCKESATPFPGMIHFIINVARHVKCFKLGLKPGWLYTSQISYCRAIIIISVNEGIFLSAQSSRRA